MSDDLVPNSKGKPSMAIPERPGEPGQLYITSQQTHSDQEGGLQPVHGALYELIITNNKGYGLFATDSISRGTRVLAESPLMTKPAILPEHALPTIVIEDLSRKLDGLTPEQHVIYFDLYHDPDVAAKAKAHIRHSHEHSKHAPVRSELPNAHKAEAIVKLHAIYQANFVELSTDEKSGTGVFPLASRINHSCVLNLQIHYIPATKTLLVHAVRHINKGEELTISYSSGLAATRNAILQHQGFECKCTICTGSQAAASQARRESMIMIELTLAAFDEPDEYARLPITPQTPQEALEAGEALMELLKTEGVADCSLQAAYRRCSKYSLQAELFDKAVTYAKKERDIERYCIGADTAQMAHLETDMRGAEFWLKHVLHERQTHQAKRKAAEKWLQEEMEREALVKKKNGGKGGKK